jgi:membrane protein DedA with SNARE-associated domain
VAVVVMATWLGAIVGDNVTFAVGRRLLGRRAAVPLEWARRRLTEHGPVIILAARFIPGGRNIVGLSAGTLGMRWRVFVVWDALAAALWAAYATALGYLTGRAFEDDLLLSLALSLALAALVGITGELALRRWSGLRRNTRADR